MEALRTVERPKNHKISITLPNNFNEDFVEVIILPYIKTELKSIEAQKSDLQKLLLDAPTMSDDDYNEFLLKKEHFNQWKPSI